MTGQNEHNNWDTFRSQVLDQLDTETALMWAQDWCEKRPEQSGRILDWLGKKLSEISLPMHGEIFRLIANTRMECATRSLELMIPRGLHSDEAVKRLNIMAQYLTSPEGWTTAQEEGLRLLVDYSKKHGKERQQRKLLDRLWPMAIGQALDVQRNPEVMDWMIHEHGYANKIIEERRGRGLNGFHLLVLSCHKYDFIRSSSKLDAGRVENVCNRLSKAGSLCDGPMIYLDQNHGQHFFSSPLALACHFHAEGDLHDFVVEALLLAGADWTTLNQDHVDPKSAQLISNHPRVRAHALEGHIQTSEPASGKTGRSL